MEPTTNSASAKITGALIIGLLVGFTAGVFWQERRGSAAPEENTSTKTIQDSTDKGLIPFSTSTAYITGKVSEAPIKNLAVKDQPAGDRVEIENIDTKEILWVAVREEKDGNLGNILGAQKVSAGSWQKIAVELLRPTVSNGTYRVVLYKDVGDPAFNYREDTLVEGIEKKFTAK